MTNRLSNWNWLEEVKNHTSLELGKQSIRHWNPKHICLKLWWTQLYKKSIILFRNTDKLQLKIMDDFNVKLSLTGQTEHLDNKIK